ncbi:hypothetical protein EYF80_047962 [Liparis tanakae]|uniref:Uncharacterized protein n=1 Tax=Liparis tanakae TaxID=230148 RepID=A0A4Z2FLS6_9TELE|nr:hypothetical protein EYF80_047962 [Liparis tanakae]
MSVKQRDSQHGASAPSSAPPAALQRFLLGTFRASRVKFAFHCVSGEPRHGPIGSSRLLGVCEKRALVLNDSDGSQRREGGRAVA